MAVNNPAGSAGNSPVEDSGQQLECGRDLDDVWARADSPPDTHELTCPQCRDARARYNELSTLTSELRARDEQDPTLQLDTDALTKITSIARAEVRRGHQIPLRQPPPESDAPDLTVTEQAIATVIRRVSDESPGIEARRCRVNLDPSHDPLSDPTLPRASDETDDLGVVDVPVRVVIELTVSASPRIPIGTQTSTLREQIMAAVAADIGVTAHTVNIHVEDVHDA